MSAVVQQRQALSRDAWERMAHETAPPLLALWADASGVYALLGDRDAVTLVSTEIEDGGYPALSPVRPNAARFERMVHDLWGHTAVGGSDQRPWLDHGKWPLVAPMASGPRPAGRAEQPGFDFPEDLDQVPLGPVRGGIEPAAHLRLGVRGETVERLEARLGYTHKGTLSLMRGKSPRAAARFAARLAGEATVAHSIAFARATEAASGCELPQRALALRDVMAEVERITHHLDADAAVAEAAGTDILASGFAVHAEAIRRAANIAFGHRLMMDCVIPGGIAADIAPGGGEAIARALSGVDVAAIADRIARLRDLLGNLPDGGVSVPLPVASGEGIGFADGPGGSIWHWLRLDHGQIASVFMRDPAWERWAELEARMSGGQAEDLPRIVAMLSLSSSGMDL
jgi:Ni,Fe-hydrogenase III large subunit